MINPGLPLPSSPTVQSVLTRYPLRFSTTQASSASRPIVTVMLGMGSANRGKFASGIRKPKNIPVKQKKKYVESNVDSVCFCTRCICGDEIEGPTKRATMTVMGKRIISFGNGGCVESFISGI